MEPSGKITDILNNGSRLCDNISPEKIKRFFSIEWPENYGPDWITELDVWDSIKKVSSVSNVTTTIKLLVDESVEMYEIIMKIRKALDLLTTTRAATTKDMGDCILRRIDELKQIVEKKR